MSMDLGSTALIIIAAGVLLAIQGLAQVFRCIITMRTNEWPRPEEDVEEMEKKLQKEGLSALHHASEAVDVVEPERKRT
ncbi:MAG: hypothetical protein KC461_11555 [Dehalococcoidia bacterium]|nr:hypothetical protein [Dehalococcoidia bacterium]